MRKENKIKSKRVISLMLTALIMLANVPPPLYAQATLRTWKANREKAKPSKLAPDLEEMLAQDDEDTRQALQGKTLAQIRSERLTHQTKQKGQNQSVENESSVGLKNSRGVALPNADVSAEAPQSFIVQLDGTTPNVVLQERLARLGGRISQQHSGMGLLTIDASRTVIRQLAAEGSIAYVSPDRAVSALGHVETTTGVEQVRALLKTNLDGSDIGIAVLDSGIDSNHQLLKSDGKHKGVGYNRNFINPKANDTEDTYGHGTFVASMASASNKIDEGAYEGLAPQANVINLRVLDSTGRGAASNLIAALDWCISNKAKYNLRVINLSLGTMAKDSYKNDPLCLAARRAVNAGIVVVASAGQ